MKTSTKVLIGVGLLLLIRARNAQQPALTAGPAAGDGSTGFGTWIGNAPVTPTFAGGEQGYGTNPISALFTALLGGNTRATYTPTSASAPMPGTNTNAPYQGGTSTGYGAAAVPGEWSDPNAAVAAPLTAADPSIMMMPVPFGDGLLWTPSPAMMG